MSTSLPTPSEKPPSFARASRANVVLRPLLLVCASLGIVLLVGLVAVFAAESVAFVRVSGGAALGSLATLLGNTLLTTVIALVVAAPVGLLAALYLSEFAGARMRGFLDPLLRFLARVPPIVYGYFAVSTFLPALGTIVPGLHQQYALSAGIALAGMIVPNFLEHGRAAMDAVPEHLRDGARALGAGKFATAMFVVVPAARSRLLAALVLAASRAVGETMIVLVVLSAWAPGQAATSHHTLATYFARFGTMNANAAGQDIGALFVVGSALLVLAFVLDGLRVALDKPNR